MSSGLKTHKRVALIVLRADIIDQKTLNKNLKPNPFLVDF